MLKLKTLLGGGALYLVAGLTLSLIYQHWKISRLAESRDHWQSAHDRAQMEVAERDTIIHSQNTQFRRQTRQNEELNNAEQYIYSAEDGRHCLDSQPVRHALEWLRVNTDGTTVDDDGTDVRLSESAKSPGGE